MTTPSQIRARLIANDFIPLPVVGKAPVIERWQERTTTSQGDLDIWDKRFPDAKSTGVQSTRNPFLDVDISDEGASDAVIALVREKFDDFGKVIVRYGRRPKCAIPFRLADGAEAFDKIKVSLIAPDGSTGQAIEFLARGQQCVVHGLHVDTREPYAWVGGSLGNTRRADRRRSTRRGRRR